jgi:hypothetical protein
MSENGDAVAAEVEQPHVYTHAEILEHIANLITLYILPMQNDITNARVNNTPLPDRVSYMFEYWVEKFATMLPAMMGGHDLDEEIQSKLDAIIVHGSVDMSKVTIPWLLKTATFVYQHMSDRCMCVATIASRNNEDIPPIESGRLAKFGGQQMVCGVFGFKNILPILADIIICDLFEFGLMPPGRYTPEHKQHLEQLAHNFLMILRINTWAHPAPPEEIEQFVAAVSSGDNLQECMPDPDRLTISWLIMVARFIYKHVYAQPDPVYSDYYNEDGSLKFDNSDDEGGGDKGDGDKGEGNGGEGGGEDLSECGGGKKPDAV